MAKDLVIVSLHEKGFWQADFYAGWDRVDESEFRNCAPSPDGFATYDIGGTCEDAMERAAETWPSARIMVAEDEYCDCCGAKIGVEADACSQCG